MVATPRKMMLMVQRLRSQPGCQLGMRKEEQ